MKNLFTKTLGSAILLGATLSISPLASADVITTQTVGTVSELDPEVMVIRTETATAPTRYYLSKDVTYVDEAGVPVAAEVVRSGAPVTVHFVREGDRSVVRRVVVRKTTPAAVVTERRAAVVETAPVVTERRTTVVEPAAPVIERRTTTTTTTTKKAED